MRIADQVFKWLALLVACGWLYLYWERRDVGRFVLTVGNPDIMVLDSKIGTYWMVGSSGGVLRVGVVNPQAGRVVLKKGEVQRPE